jgi:hypothetical protein
MSRVGEDDVMSKCRCFSESVEDGRRGEEGGWGERKREEGPRRFGAERKDVGGEEGDLWWLCRWLRCRRQT